MDTYKFTVEPFTEDVTGRLSWSVLGNHLLRVANLSASSHHFGFSDMQTAKHAWVLSRLVIEMNEMPRTGECYDITTWVSKIYRQFTDRLFSIKKPDGSAYGHAYSVWALIDLDTRMPADLQHLPNGCFHDAVETQVIPIDGPSRIRVKTDGAVRDTHAMYGDLDINGHVNSIRYLQMALDTIYQQYPDDLKPLMSRVRRVEMTYSAESYFGDHLQFFIEKQSHQKYACEIKKPNAESVVKCLIDFFPAK